MGTAAANPQTSGAYQLGALSGAMTGSTTITANISTAQTTAGQKLTDHTLKYVQIGSYLAHGTSGPFTLSATNQQVEDALYQFLTANSSGLKAAFPSASYTAADGEALNWLLTGNSNGTYLGTDVSGQANYDASENTDYAVRLLANYLYANSGSTTSIIPSTDLKTATWTGTTTNSTGTFTLPAPGVYLIVDTTDSGNESLPIILSTKPSTGYAIPTGMENYVTDKIALKDQDPQAMPVKQFVTDPTTSDGDLTGGTITGTMTSTVGSADSVTYQVSNVFPNTNGYPAYTYKFIDNPGIGMTLNIAETFQAATPYTGTTVNSASDGGLFQISGLGAGTYKVTETQQATGAASVLPSFYVTIASGKPEVISFTAPEGAASTNGYNMASSYNLVNNTSNGNPFNSNEYNTVENIKSLMGLPLTGGAGILTGVIAAVILFGTAGIVLVVYKRRKQQED